MRTTRRIADAENLYVVAEFTERSGCRRSTQTRTDDNDFHLSLVAGRYNPDLRLVLCPFFGQRTLRNL